MKFYTLIGYKVLCKVHCTVKMSFSLLKTYKQTKKKLLVTYIKLEVKALKSIICSFLYVGLFLFDPLTMLLRN